MSTRGLWAVGLWMALAVAACSNSVDLEALEPGRGADDVNNDVEGCEPPLALCDGRCVNTSQVEHCGGCDPCVAAPGAMVEACIEGTCQQTCQDDRADQNDDLGLGSAGDGCECDLQASESCNGQDEDCDGDIDEGVANACGGCSNLGGRPGDPCQSCGELVCDGLDALRCEETGTPFFRDEDGDGFGVDGDSVTACGPSSPYTARLDGDCDDQEFSRNPGAPETCDGVDSNCNGLNDDEDPELAVFRCDRLGDFGGLCAEATARCTLDGPICDEEAFERHAASIGSFYEPVVEIQCDGVNNNCDDVADENCCDNMNSGQERLAALRGLNAVIGRRLPAVAFDPAGQRAVAVWIEHLDRIVNEDQTLARLPSNPLGGMIYRRNRRQLRAPSVLLSGDVTEPRVAFHEAGVDVLAMSINPVDGLGNLVWRRFDPSAEVLPGETRLAVGIVYFDAEALGDGTLHVVWMRKVDDSYFLEGLVVSPQGQPGPTVTFSAARPVPQRLDLAISAEGGAVVLYDPAAPTRDYTLVTYNNSLNPVATNTLTSPDQVFGEPAVLSRGPGRYALVFGRNRAQGGQLLVRPFSQNASPTNDSVTINVPRGHNLIALSAASAADGGAILWAEQLEGRQETTVRFLALDAEARAIGEPYESPIASRTTPYGLALDAGPPRPQPQSRWWTALRSDAPVGIDNEFLGDSLFAMFPAGAGDNRCFLE